MIEQKILTTFNDDHYYDHYHDNDHVPLGDRVMKLLYLKKFMIKNGNLIPLIFEKYYGIGSSKGEEPIQSFEDMTSLEEFKNMSSQTIRKLHTRGLSYILRIKEIIYSQTL